MGVLNNEEIELIQESYERIRLSKGFLADAFYRKLFRLAPEARGLFQADLSQQMGKFSSMLDFLVNNLHQPWFFTGKLKKLAKRHVAYGALPEHYALVGQALIAALHEVASGGMSDREEQAWKLLFSDVSGTMIEAAYPDAA